MVFRFVWIKKPNCKLFWTNLPSLSSQPTTVLRNAWSGGVDAKNHRISIRTHHKFKNSLLHRPGKWGLFFNRPWWHHMDLSWGAQSFSVLRLPLHSSRRVPGWNPKRHSSVSNTLTNLPKTMSVSQRDFHESKIGLLQVNTFQDGQRRYVCLVTS